MRLIFLEDTILVAQQLYMSSCIFCLFVLFCLSHLSTYKLTSPNMNSKVFIQTHKTTYTKTQKSTLLDLIRLNVLCNFFTDPYLFLFNCMIWREFKVMWLIGWCSDPCILRIYEVECLVETLQTNRELSYTILEASPLQTASNQLCICF